MLAIDFNAFVRAHAIVSALLLAIVTSAIVAETTDAVEPAGDAARWGELSIRYNRDIRPILADNCFACHGPDSASRKAELRLDDFTSASEMNAIVPGDVEASELLRRIRLPESDDLAMPPGSGHKRLSDDQKQTLERWIAQGAKYEPHWSLIAPTKPAIPSVVNEAWVRNPIDAFVLAKLDAVGLPPAPEADRRTIARRLSLDLVGLPPTPQTVEEFAGDPSPDYYERYVDALLKSARYGEHRGRYWLDYARYADTHGIHFDNFREMWSYRDWVIDAFNRNLPFDQFTIQQLAGDLLPSPTLDQLIASGFNRCNITTNEGGIIDEEYKVLYARDRTETTSTVWMALTTGCAVCHDHKFDPVSQRDFYALSAFFNNTTQAVRDGNIANTPPIVDVPLLEERARYGELNALIADTKSDSESARAAARKQFDAGDKPMDARAVANKITTERLRFHALLNEGSGSGVASVVDGNLRLNMGSQSLVWAEGHVAPGSLVVNDKSSVEVGDVVGNLEFDKPFSYGAWIYLNNANPTGAVIARMDEANEHRGFDLWLEGARIGAHLVHKWPENSVKVVTKEALPKDQWHHVFVTYDGKGKAAGLQIYVNGKVRTDRIAEKNKLTASIRTDVPFRIGGRSAGNLPQGVRVNDVRVYDRKLTDPDVAEIAINTRVSYVAQQPSDNRNPEDADELFAYWLKESSPDYAAALAKVTALEDEKEAIRKRGTVAHVMNERAEPAVAFVLERGEYDQQRDEVAAAVPGVLPPMAADLPANRLGLAKWLVAPEHPLMARVTVNRVWQEVFGTGLVATTGDFGVTGELPSHPELLDWLAVDLRENGWDMKRLYRLILTSSTYRQSAATTAEKIDIDAANRFLSRGPRFRLDAEMIRDYALQVSGLLSTKIGGASVKPYQPEGVWEAVAMTPSNTRIYKQDDGEALYRRSMYTFWKRSAPPASMDVFNAPSREVCNVRRERTNTPLQALAALNDPQLIEAARHLAAKSMRQSSETDVRIEYLASQVLLRPLSDDERKIVADSLAALADYYETNPEDAAKLVATGESTVPSDLAATQLAALTMLANQLLNVDEALNK